MKRTSLNALKDYEDFIHCLPDLPQWEASSLVRLLCRTDLYFLLWYGCGRADIAKPWLLERCKEVEASPNGHLDLWAREHYKSTIITFGKTIQDILASHGEQPLPEWKGIEPTFGIFSHTRPIAKGFLRQIKREFESNLILRDLFPDVVWRNCNKEAPKWSEDDGLVLRRTTNPKESTVEAWGLVDGQPTSKHFFVKIYDDVVTIESVRSDLMIAKTTESWELSLNLGVSGGFDRYIGTRYHFNDTWRVIMSRQAAVPRIYPATMDGAVEGEPVLMSKEELDRKRRLMGPYTFSTQMLLNPLADETQGFRRDWIRYYDGSDGSGMNIYIVVDPANEKKKNSDYTVMEVIGLGEDENYYTLDLVRDRLNLDQRTDILFRLHRKWRPISVGYESYGKDVDISHINYVMKQKNYRFSITSLGGKLKKPDRIKMLIPIFSNGRWWLPNSIFKTNYEGRIQDLIDVFLHEEYDAFPVPVHDDMLDAKARILDEELGAIFPRLEEEKGDRYSRAARRRGGGGGGSAWSA